MGFRTEAQRFFDEMASEQQDAAREADATEMRSLGAIVPAVLDRMAVAREISPMCESPIEIDFGAELLLRLRKQFSNSCLCRQGEAAKFTDHLLLIPQYVSGPYRYDFALADAVGVLCFIECDGQEYHSTEDQIARDQRKDAHARAAGVDVLRFSGSDIYNQVDRCARLVLGHIHERGQ